MIVDLHDRIEMILQETTPLKKKLDEFGTFLAKVFSVIIFIIDPLYKYWIIRPFKNVLQLMPKTGAILLCSVENATL